MSYLEEQKLRVQQSITTPYQRIILALGSSSECIVCALEGITDLPFYDPLLRRYSRLRDCPKPRSVHCGSRDNVLNTRERLNAYKDRVVYVIDKGHSNYTNMPIGSADDVFITKYYSVESYSVGLNQLRDLVAEMFALEPDSRLINECIEQFDAAFSTFVQEMLEIHAIAIVLKRGGYKLHLSDVKPYQIFNVNNLDFNWSLPSKEQSKKLLFAECGISWAIVEDLHEEVAVLEEQLCREEPLGWLHGKYVLYFFTRFLSGWYKKNAELTDNYGRSPAITTNINEAYVLNFVALFHGAVAEFTSFLDRQFRQPRLVAGGATEVA